MKIKKENVKKEKMFDIKVNRKALDKFMARFFWYAVASITALATVLLITSIRSFCIAWKSVAESLYLAWMVLETPFITSVLCLAWFVLVYLFFHLIRED